MGTGRHPLRRLLGISLLAMVLSGVGGVMFLRTADPAARGEFAVGTMSLEPGRCTGFVGRIGQDGARPVPDVQLWYPASPRHGGASAGRDLPVVLYFSGWAGIRVENLSAVQALASQGFVVATTVYPARLPGIPKARWQAQLAELERPMDFSSEAAFEETLRRSNDRVRARAEDAVAILDLLAKLDHCDPASPIAHRLDTNRAGIFGYSFGGAVAAEASRMDHRFRAVVNLDGWLYADAAKHGVTCAYLSMSDDSPVPTAADIAAATSSERYRSILTKTDYDQTIANMKRHGGVMVTIRGSGHTDFLDAGSRSLWQSIGLTGKTAQRTRDMVAAYVLAFMQSHLAGRDSPLLPPNAVTPAGVRLEVWERPTSSGAAAPVN